jgi:hypothetical protein
MAHVNDHLSFWGTGRAAPFLHALEQAFGGGLAAARQGRCQSRDLAAGSAEDLLFERAEASFGLRFAELAFD